MTQILVAVANNAGQIVKAHVHQAKLGAAPARLPVKEGQMVVLQVDGQQQSGSVLMLGKRPILRKSGKDLAVEVDGKAVVVLVEFFAVKGARLYGDEWTLLPNQNLDIGPQGVFVRGQTELAAVGMSGTTRDVAAVGMSGTTRDVAAVGMSGTTRDVAAVGLSGTTRDVAAVGLSGTTRDVAAVGISSTSQELAAVGMSGTKMAALAAGVSLLPLLGAMGKGGGEDPGSSGQLSGSVVAGPVTEGLKVQIYKLENGNLTLLGTTDVAPGGRWSYDMKGYTGSVVVKVLDANGADGNYWSELTGQAVDLNVAMIAVANLQAGANTVNITPVTTIAALKAGLAVDADGAISNSMGLGLNRETIDSNNSVLAKVLMLSNILTDEVRTTVGKETGQDTYSTSNAYGKVLAAIEGLGGNDQNKLQDLAGMLRVDDNNADWNLVAKQALVSGAANVELERQQTGLLTAVAALVSRSTSDARLLIAPLGNNNIITDETRGAFQLRVTAPTQTSELVVYINGEAIELTAADVTHDGNGNWTVQLSSQSWPYGPNELKVEAMLGADSQALVSTSQLFSVVNTKAPFVPSSDWDQIIQVAGMTETSTVNGGDGHDFFRVSAQSDRQLELRGQAGDDAFQFLGANSGNFTVDGGAGNDSISLSAQSTGRFTLLLGDGDDRVNAWTVTVGLAVFDGAGRDNLTLGRGNDTVHVQNDATNDCFIGGKGSDALTYENHSAGLTFNINIASVDGGKDGRVFQTGTSGINDMFYSFEAFVGGTGNDIFNVNYKTEVGGVLTVGGKGTDVLRYGSNNTSDLTVQVAAGTDADGCTGTVSSASGTNHFEGMEHFYLGKGNDAFVITGTSKQLKVNTGTGNDTITISAVNNRLNAGGVGFTEVLNEFDWSGDVLNLQGFWTPGTVTASNIEQYVKISTHTRTVAVDVDGTGSSNKMWDIARFSDGDKNFISLAQLLESGHLIISA